MRPLAVAALVLAAVAAVVPGATPWILPHRAHAQTMPTALFVSGLHVNGSAPGTLVELTNTSQNPADFYAITYLLFHADGNRAAATVTVPQPLTAGRKLTIDVGAAVATYRAQNDIAPFSGPVTVVLYGASCADNGTCPNGFVPRPFGP